MARLIWGYPLWALPNLFPCERVRRESFLEPSRIQVGGPLRGLPTICLSYERACRRSFPKSLLLDRPRKNQVFEKIELRYPYDSPRYPSGYPRAWNSIRRAALAAALVRLVKRPMCSPQHPLA